MIGHLPSAWGQSGESEPAGSVSKPAASDSNSPSDPLPVALPGDTVVIKREAVSLLDPHKYRVALYLSPVRSVTLAAPIDGILRDLPVKTSEPLLAQAEVARLDNTYQKIRLQRAQSLLKVALLEQKLVAADAADELKELTQAKVEAAEADVALAMHELDLTNVRMPFNGEVLRFLVSEGQYVKAGEPVAIAGDLSQLTVEIPAERSQVAGVKTFPIKVEGTEVEAQVESVLPLDRRFDVLRELFDSITSARLVIDNAQKRFHPGETVFVPLIPRHPVTEVPTGSIGNRPDGGRKVQVLRDGVVRDVPVVLMASVGLDRVFVSGPFAPGDEVITSSSHQLSDGFTVERGSGKGNRAGGAGTPGTPGSGQPRPKPPATDF